MATSGTVPVGNRGQRQSFRSLRTKFVIIFLLLAVVPLLAVTAFVRHRTFANLEEQNVALQHEAAVRVAAEVESVILGRVAEIALLDETVALGELDTPRQRDIMKNLLASQRMYQNLSLVEANGTESIRVSRDGAVVAADLRNWVGTESYAAAIGDKVTQFGHVVFDDAAREPLVGLLYPLLNRRTGDVTSILAATVRFKPIWDLLTEQDLVEDREVFVLNESGVVVAHRNPAVVLAGTTFDIPEADGRILGLSGQESVAATVTVPFGAQRLFVVAEQPVSSALAVASSAMQVTTAVMLAALLAVSMLVALGGRFLVGPLRELAASARRIAAGDFSHRVVSRTADETGDLADAFNLMSDQLEDLVETLEQRVADRTADLAEAAHLQQELIAELETRNEEMAQVHRQLEQLMDSKDELVGAVSHELRTPLTSVLGFAAVLRDSHRELDAEELDEFIMRIVGEAQDMANIINDLLIAARSDSSQLMVQPEPVDVAEGIRSVIERLPQVEPSFNTESAPAIAHADPTRLRQILRNLIVNAERYGGSEVTIGLESDNGHLVVQVRDNGVGLPEEEWESVFDPYRRSHHRKGQPASVGLGLTVSRMLARRMEGDLTYRYESDESVFELTLPAPPVSATT